MRTLTRCFALALFCVCAIFGQAYDRYTTSVTVNLTDQTTAFAVQLPSTGAHQTEIVEIGLQCSSDCPLRFENNSAVANSGNATAATVVPLNPETTPTALISSPNVQAWYGASIPTGTVVVPTFVYPGGAYVPFGGGRILTSKTATNVNYIARVSSNYTGSVTLFFSLRVRR